MESNRRTFLKALTLAPLTGSVLNTENELAQIEPEVQPIFALNKIGSIKLKKPKDIKSSPFGIGCETLDRALWDPKEVYPFLDDLPVKWARLQTGWNRVEREKGKYDWKWLDESVDGLIERGIQPFFNVGYGNKFYTEDEMGYHPMNNPDALKAFKLFVTALAKRYKGKVSHYEIWNEPNLKGFWKPGEIDPKKYVQLVRETAPLIRSNCPNAVIVGGVTSRLPYTFIKSLFEAGLGKEIDIFSFHPYNTIPETYNERIVAVTRLAKQYNPKIKIWQGENGFPSEPNSTGFIGEGPYTENIQAKIMLRRLITDCSLDIPMTLWFLIVDLHDYPKGTGKVNYKGILKTKPTIAPKVAYKVLQNLGSVVHGDVHTGNAIIHILDGEKAVGEKDYADLGNRFVETLANTRATVLNTANGKVLAYWSLDKAADQYPSRSAHIFLWDWEGTGFADPVVIDPLTSDIYELPEHQKFNDNDTYRISQEAQLFAKLPLRDYPMLIMEKKSVI
ncbi:GH39 family glycosyl hydrolase [Dyadobacter sp. CY323]|uniref:GH39 family glycosyl hydrolase n=1 Tax=Dyadobacter sp. CY323 TaxID=2907302 RepID=UPI001F48B9B4|nr:cellulase family glycosylhydrolase [Dyadobacter sp. CY323]MCE6991208.1 cellulase family glycosylhydrolase [Dyadobacter sp. CY323]